MKHIKQIVVVVIFLVAAFKVNGQAPQMFNYQAVARNSSGGILASTSIGVRLTIRDGGTSGSIQYQETQSATTNAYGLFTLHVGGGTVATGSMSGVTWGSGNKYLQVEVDPTGGTSYVDMGAQQLVSVPYALFAANGGGSGSGTVTSVTAGTGLVGGTITTAGTISLPNVGTSGTYGSSTSVPVITTDAQGRVSGITSATIAGGISGSGTTNYITKFASGASIMNSSIFDNGNVGIGTTSPSTNLHVVGGIYQSQTFASHAMNINHSGSSGMALQAKITSTSNSSIAALVQTDGTGRAMEIDNFNSSNPNALIYISNAGPGRFIDASNGAYLSNGGVWVNVSDKSMKENIQSVDGTQILKNIAQLKITTWNYTREGKSAMHIGPMAEDFYNIFHVGNDSKSISTIDPAGVALVGVQELYRLNVDLQKQNLALKETLNSQDQKIDELQKQINELMQQMAELRK